MKHGVLCLICVLFFYDYFSMVDIKFYTHTEFLDSFIIIFIRNPTPDASLGVIWPEYDNVQEQYMDIGETLTPGRKPNKDIIEFWQSIFEEAERK